MAISLSNLNGNITLIIQKLEYKYCDCFLEYEGVKNNLIKCKSLSCNKDYSNKIDEE